MALGTVLTYLIPVAVVGGLILFTDIGKKMLRELGIKHPFDSNYAAGAYAVDLRQLPYDPNNYYYPR